MIIEPATLSDAPAMVDLLTLLFAQESEFQPDPEAQLRGISRIIQTPEVGCILVAREHTRIIGMVNLLYTVSTALGKRVAILEDMIVLPQTRGCGIGTQLLDAAIAHARDAGCKRITLLTDHDNIDAQRFYARQGFQPSSMIPLRLAL